MKIKTITLAILITVGFPLVTQAQETSTHKNLKVSCNSVSECSDYKVNYEQNTDDDQVAQTRRTRTRRTRKSSADSKYYVGGNLGVLFPSEDNLDTGFGLGTKFGYKFNKNIAGELEGISYFGGTDTDDLGYNLLGVAANGVFQYPFNPDNEKSVYGFAGGGIGIGRFAFTGDASEDDSDETGLLLQGKVGVGYPVSDKLDVFGQVRYVDVSLDEDEVGDFDANGFTIDTGITYNF